MSASPFIGELALAAQERPADVLAQYEPFWTRLAQEYDRDESFIQLNYGFYHPSLKAVLDVELAAARSFNRQGSYFKLEKSPELLEATRADLARLAEVETEEIVITRNASESLNLVLQGIALEAGDEVICTDHEYIATDEALDQRAKNESIRVRRVALPFEPRDDEEIVRLFEAEITPRTRLIQVTHLIHFTGQVLPVEKLCALARARGIPVLVDAAHSFAQIDFSVGKLGCDYLAASLHKWLGGPLGTGLLYVRKDRISGLRPLFGDTRHASDDIRRLERFGNRPDSLNAGLREAIRWHRAIGCAAKQARLCYLQRCWTDPLRQLPRFRVFTPAAAGRYGALGLCTLEGVSAGSLCDYLMREHRIFTAVQSLPSFNGVRVTPGLPTSHEHMLRLVDALLAAADHF